MAGNADKYSVTSPLLLEGVSTVHRPNSDLSLQAGTGDLMVMVTARSLVDRALHHQEILKQLASLIKGLHRLFIGQVCPGTHRKFQSNQSGTLLVSHSQPSMAV